MGKLAIFFRVSILLNSFDISSIDFAMFNLYYEFGMLLYFILLINAKRGFINLAVKQRRERIAEAWPASLGQKNATDIV